MNYEVVWSLTAKKDLDKLPRAIAQRIVAKIHQHAKSSNPIAFAKRLAGSFAGYYRFRVGDYRVIFEKEVHSQMTLLLILSVDKRDKAYF